VGVFGEKRHSALHRLISLILSGDGFALALRGGKIIEVAGEDRATALAQECLDQEHSLQPSGAGLQSGARPSQPPANHQDLCIYVGYLAHPPSILPNPTAYSGCIAALDSSLNEAQSSEGTTTQ